MGTSYGKAVAREFRIGAMVESGTYANESIHIMPNHLVHRPRL